MSPIAPVEGKRPRLWHNKVQERWFLGKKGMNKSKGKNRRPRIWKPNIRGCKIRKRFQEG